MPYLLAMTVWTVASSAPSLALPFSSVAAEAQWGVRLLQWPHLQWSGEERKVKRNVCDKQWEMTSMTSQGTSLHLHIYISKLWEIKVDRQVGSYTSHTTD